jgi:hypothetical protein
MNLAVVFVALEAAKEWIHGRNLKQLMPANLMPLEEAP